MRSLPTAQKVAGALITMLTVSLLATASASAVTAGWMLNGKLLKEQGLSSTALKTTAVSDEATVLTVGSLVMTCTGPLESTASALEEGSQLSATSLIFTGCTAKAPCTVPATIGTVPVLAEVTLEGSLAVKAIVKPKVGAGFVTLKLGGEACALAGNRSLNGDFEVLLPEGQDERTDQLLKIVQAPSGLLKLSATAASLSGSALLLLANNQRWSFL